MTSASAARRAIGHGVVVASLLALGAASSASPLAAQASSARARALLEEGRAHYGELEYGEAAASLTSALALAEHDDALRAEILEALALDYFVMDREDAARASLVELFTLDPYYVVREPSGSPRVARFVESVRRTRVEDAALDPDVRLRSELPSAARSDARAEIAITAGAPIARVRVWTRTDVSASWEGVEGRHVAGSRWIASLPPLRDASEVLLWIEGRDERGRVVAREGSPLAPRALPIVGVERPTDGADVDVVREPWFWVLVGTVVVGVGVGVGVGVTLSDAAVPSGTLAPGVIRLP